MATLEHSKALKPPTRLRLKYAVTFEFGGARAPITHRGIVEGWAASTCTRRAVEEAQGVVRPINWTSMVCVLLERLSALDDDGTSFQLNDDASVCAVSGDA